MLTPADTIAVGDYEVRLLRSTRALAEIANDECAGASAATELFMLRRAEASP